MSSEYSNDTTPSQGETVSDTASNRVEEISTSKIGCESEASKEPTFETPAKPDLKEPTPPGAPRKRTRKDRSPAQQEVFKRAAAVRQANLELRRRLKEHGIEYKEIEKLKKEQELISKQKRALQMARNLAQVVAKEGYEVLMGGKKAKGEKIKEMPGNIGALKDTEDNEDEMVVAPSQAKMLQSMMALQQQMMERLDKSSKKRGARHDRRSSRRIDESDTAGSSEESDHSESESGSSDSDTDHRSSRRRVSHKAGKSGKQGRTKKYQSKRQKPYAKPKAQVRYQAPTDTETETDVETVEVGTRKPARQQQAQAQAKSQPTPQQPSPEQRKQQELSHFMRLLGY